MRIELEIEMAETGTTGGTIGMRRFSRTVDVPELPTTGSEMEINFGGEPVIMQVADIANSVDNGIAHVKVSSSILTASQIREDERWTETLV